MTKKVGTSLFLLFMLFIALMLILFGNNEMARRAKVTPSPTPIATPSASLTPTTLPKSVIITQPEAGKSATQQSPQIQPQPQVINNNTVQPAPAPQTSTAPQPTPSQSQQKPDTIDVGDILRKIL